MALSFGRECERLGMVVLNLGLRSLIVSNASFVGPGESSAPHRPSRLPRLHDLFPEHIDDLHRQLRLAFGC
jgi:hypothetical protein